MTAFSNQQTNQRLQNALDAASGQNPTGLIIRGPDGTLRRVSWVDVDENLMHRPFNGPFPPGYRQDIAIQQCQEVFRQLLGTTHEPARDRAYTMLLMAEADLHSFDHEAGRELTAQIDQAGLDDDAKRTVILKLYPHVWVGVLLLQRFGIKPRWLAGNPARFLSRLMRRYEYSPALVRNLLEHMGTDPDTYYMIGPDYWIPEPSEEDRARCVQKMQELGFSDESIRAAMATLGVPPGGQHPPKRRNEKTGKSAVSAGIFGPSGT